MPGIAYPWHPAVLFKTPNCPDTFVVVLIVVVLVTIVEVLVPRIVVVVLRRTPVDNYNFLIKVFEYMQGIFHALEYFHNSRKTRLLPIYSLYSVA